MIEIISDGTSIGVKLKGGFETKSSTFTLRWDTGVEYVAEMLSWHLRRRLEGAIERTRRAAYEQGWKDAKSKKCAKQTWFSSDLED